MGQISRIALVLATLAIAGCGSAARNAAPSASEIAADFKGSPAPLAALHDKANRLLSGGATAFSATLRGLRGYPVIVNKWGSWCPPCRQEFPVFQRVAAHLGRRVAFLGDDVNEASVHDAVNWLARFPLTYPSFSDHSNAIANLLGRPTATYTPVTYFYNARGRQVFYHDGPYVSVASLEHDIRFYLGG